MRQLIREYAWIDEPDGGIIPVNGYGIISYSMNSLYTEPSRNPLGIFPISSFIFKLKLPELLRHARHGVPRAILIIDSEGSFLFNSIIAEDTVTGSAGSSL